jgi:DNA-binding GntR family transcriptional regulator
MAKPKIALEHQLSGESIEKFIVERIYRAVMEQRLPPKTKLSESKLCETFGVGRMHVRRALLLLSSEGIIALHSNRGAYVSSPDQKEANEVFEARLMIEPPLVRKLAGSVSATKLSVLFKHLEQENVARQNDDRTNLIRLSGEFHVKLADTCGNSIISKTVRELVTKTSLIVGMYGSSSHSSCPDDEHQRLLEAIKANESDLAQDIISEHLKHIWKGLHITAVSEEDNQLEQILGGKL